MILLVILGGMEHGVGRELCGGSEACTVWMFRSSNTIRSGASSAKEAQDINYIKRLWGLPGETLKISGGDVFKFDPRQRQIPHPAQSGKSCDMALQGLALVSRRARALKAASPIPNSP